MSTRALVAAAAALATAAAFAIVSAPAEAHGRGAGGGGHGGGHRISGGGGGWHHHGGGRAIVPLSGGLVGHATITPRLPAYSPGLSAYPHRPYAPVVVAPIVRPHVVAPIVPRVVYAAPPVVYYGAQHYYAPPPVIYTPPPVTYIEQAPPQPQLWYFCRDYQAYYPNVEQCPSEWVTVPATN